ncbi:protein MKS1 [Musa acuminata AAA Group]|uniref:protein MKS1 n=1 Tax=Musa acuminata AAA Group TaxID=214697 RepID=UPI0031E42309
MSSSTHVVRPTPSWSSCFAFACGNAVHPASHSVFCADSSSPPHSSALLEKTMDPSESRPSPRRQVQGPRPTPLKVFKDSYKIKKPPVAPPPRVPLVIYAVSPKIIHALPGEFMTLVQRLTGPSSSADPSPTGELSPASRIAAFERATPTHAGDRAGTDGVDQLGIERWPTLDRPASFPGILSPLPWALPPISPKLFSPSFDPSVFSILQELSPVFGSSSSSGGKAFLTSPSNSFLSTPIVPSPGACWDLLSQFPDL